MTNAEEHAAFLAAERQAAIEAQQDTAYYPEDDVEDDCSYCGVPLSECEVVQAYREYSGNEDADGDDAHPYLYDEDYDRENLALNAIREQYGIPEYLLDGYACADELAGRITMYGETYYLWEE